MTMLAERLLESGIRPRSYADGTQKLLCPKCSHTRRNRNDPCLSLTIDRRGATWLCHHCEWRGSLSERVEERAGTKKAPPTRPRRAPDAATEAVLRWLADRGISEATARRNQIGAAKVFVPTIGSETDCVAFPYFKAGVLVNVKYRALASKAFTQVKGAEKIFYGLDDIADCKRAIIVEGECDKLACEEADLRHVVSVPNGASASADPDAAAFEYLDNCATYLDQCERIVLALDADDKGSALETELARRLGRERCWRVRWPDSGDAPCKDANETLQCHGAQVLRECIEQAEPYPIAGLHSANDFLDDTLALYRDGHKRGHSTGWASLDELMTIREGELTVVTGIPNSGKSEFIDALTINLAQRYGWRFAVCSFENPPAEHLSKLAEKYLELPFWEGPRQRMTEAELRRAMDWLAEHYHLIRFDDDAPTIEAILEKARAAVVRYGSRGLVIDPYNEIEHRRPANMSETEYVSQTLGRVRRFAQNHGVHVWFVAHPRIMRREGRSTGPPPMPTLYDISGSANWANKADIGIVVHRDPASDPFRAEIHVRKVRFKSVGKIGSVALRWDRATGRYSEESASPYTARSAYRDD